MAAWLRESQDSEWQISHVLLWNRVTLSLLYITHLFFMVHSDMGHTLSRMHVLLFTDKGQFVTVKVVTLTLCFVWLYA